MGVCSGSLHTDVHAAEAARKQASTLFLSHLVLCFFLFLFVLFIFFFVPLSALPFVLFVFILLHSMSLAPSLSPIWTITVK